MFLMMILINQLFKYMWGTNTPAPRPENPDGTPTPRIYYENEVWPDEHFNLSVYLSPTGKSDDGRVIWYEPDIFYNFNETNYREKNVTVPYSEVEPQMWLISELVSE
jgi:hypothetical protein